MPYKILATPDVAQSTVCTIKMLTNTQMFRKTHRDIIWDRKDRWHSGEDRFFRVFLVHIFLITHFFASISFRVSILRYACTDILDSSSANNMWKICYEYDITLCSPAVTICTTSLTFNNSTFCPHSVFMCFVWISEQTAIITLYNINWLVFVTEI